MLSQILTFLSVFLDFSDKRGTASMQTLIAGVNAFAADLTEEQQAEVERELTRVVGGIGYIAGTLEPSFEAAIEAFKTAAILNNGSNDESAIEDKAQAVQMAIGEFAMTLASTFLAGREAGKA